MATKSWLVFSFACDWSREWYKFSGPIIEWSKAKTKNPRFICIPITVLMNEASPNNPWKLSNRTWRLIPFVMTPLNLNTTFYILLLHRTKGFFFNNNDLQNLQKAGNLYLVGTGRLVLPNHLAAAMNCWSYSLCCYHFTDVCAIEVRFFRFERLKAMDRVFTVYSKSSEGTPDCRFLSHPFSKSLMILSIWLALIGAIYSRIALFLLYIPSFSQPMRKLY